MSFFPATRAEGEARLHGFVPRMGLAYARRRNTDHGPGAHRDVSGLSPWVRRRLVLESDLVAAAIAAHGPADAEKFVAEVVWRSYFKGWLERRPGIWSAYVDGLAQDRAAVASDRRLRARLERAESGETGLDCFDAWLRELVETGYLHNHARMWFASIWIFTLDLPWRLGADLMFRHLLDGDPASNTLGWRWVAGLHTRGKAYAADASNIATFTAGRFRPRPSDLAATVVPLDHLEPQGLPAVSPLRSPDAPQPRRPAVLLITEDDCRPEDFACADLDIRAVATLSGSHLRSDAGVSPLVTAFEAEALADAAARIGRPQTEALRAGVPGDLARWAQRHGAVQIVTPYIPEGPLRDWLRAAAPALRDRGIALCEWRRDWDSAIWPHATAGFFKVRERIPAILDRLGIG